MAATIPILPMGGDHLYYAYHDGTKWNYQTVDSSSGVGSLASIDLDTSSNVHISYFYGINGDLKYATNASGSWITTTVDSSGWVGWYTSLAVDTSGNVHISYFNYTNWYLKYATNVSGSWVTTVVDSSIDVGKYTSLAVDKLGKVHISYYDGYHNYALKYATNAMGAWVMTTVDSSVYVGYDNSIAVDTSGKVHISYFDAANRDLKYATNALKMTTVKTYSATEVTDNSATLNGTVNGHGLTTRVWFQYGTTSGSYTDNSSKKTVKGSLNKKVSINIAGLTSQTTYYYRIIARNKAGTASGKERSFTTQ